MDECFNITHSYRVFILEMDYSGSLFFHLINNFLMFKIHFHILNIWTFYDLSSFFDLSQALFHKLVFFKKIFFSYFFSKILFLHLLNHILMSKIRFHIHKTMKFDDISSFFALSQVLIHKSGLFSKKNFHFFFQKKFFLKIFSLQR